MSKNRNSLKNIIVTAALVVIGVVSLTIFLSCTLFRKNKDRPAFVFGYTYLYVETNSMESTIPARSYILVKKAGKTPPQKQDVIVFICRDPSLPVYKKLVTHRVIDITPEGEYVTKGDYPLCTVDKTTVKNEDVVAVYVRNSKLLTFFGRLFASKAGLFVIIGIFAFSVVFVYLPDLVKTLSEEKSDSEEKQVLINRRIEEEIRRLELADQNGNSDLPEKRTNASRPDLPSAAESGTERSDSAEKSQGSSSSNNDENR